MTPDNQIANLQISSDKHMWKLLTGMYNARPLFPVTVRELLQNSHDAQKSAGVVAPIVFTIVRDTNNAFTLQCRDAGVGMDISTIHNKFLILGESGKEDGVGGFGVAKASILGACSSWELQTLDNLLTSEMLGKSPVSKTDYVDGCSITLKYDAGEGNALKPSPWSIRDALSYIVTSNVAARVITRDGDGSEAVLDSAGLMVDEKRLIATVEDEFNTLKIYLVPQVMVKPFVYCGYGVSEHRLSGRIIYRMNGLTQFVAYSCNSEASFNAVVDVTTKARPREMHYPFTVSREEMVYTYSSAVDEKVRNLFVNNLSTETMLREKVGEKSVVTTYYDGDLCSTYGKASRAGEAKKVEREEKEREKEEIENQRREAMNGELAGVVAAFVDEEPTAQKSDVRGEVVSEAVEKVLRSNLERSPTGIKTCIRIEGRHKHVKPLTARNIKLLQAWTALIGMLMEASPRYQHPFGVGLIFDNDYAALRYAENGTVYYLFNPLQYKVSDTMNTAMMMFLDACHEVTHTRCGQHNEDFTVSEDTVQRRFIQGHGMNALYALARYIRLGGRKEKGGGEV